MTEIESDDGAPRLAGSRTTVIRREHLLIRINEAGEDLDKLAELEQLLAPIPEYRAERFRIVGRMMAIRRADATRTEVGRSLSRYGVMEPDGRWLHEYRISDKVFETLEQDICRASTGDQIFLGANPARFVLWAAEWFRRFHAGGLRKWEDLEAALGTSRSQHEWRDITARGLAQWRRPIITGHNFRYFLSTLAREGGFPAAALDASHRGWASEFLRAVVGALLTEQHPHTERALHYSRRYQGMLPPVFSDEDFLILCADVAVAVVTWRKQAEARTGTSGIPASAWLDANKPGWREQLPIVTDGAAATRLLDDLMEVEAAKVSRGFVEASRFLVRTGRSWSEAALLELDGELAPELTKRLRGLGALHVHPGAGLSRYVPRELAVVETLDDDDDEKLWLKALQRRPSLETIPFSCPIDLEVRSEAGPEARLKIPGGNPLRSSLLVCKVERQDDEGPSELLVCGTGSGRYTDDELVLEVPCDWNVSPAAPDEKVEALEFARPDRSLWRIVGGAAVTDPQGDCFRILAGQTEDRPDRIRIGGELAPEILQPDRNDTELLVAPVAVDLWQGRKKLQSAGKLSWRGIGERSWKPIKGSPPPGHYELGWVDGGLVRDRVRVAILPQEAKLDLHLSSDRVRYELSGWGDCQLLPEATAPVRLNANGELVGNTGASTSRFFSAQLRWGPSDEPLAVRVRFPCGATLCRWDGRVEQPGSTISVSELDEVMACADGKMQLFGRVVDGEGRRVPGTEMRWSFTNQMPMKVTSGDIRSLLQQAGPNARAELGMLDGVENFWSITQFHAPLIAEGPGIVSTRGVTQEGTILVVRPLLKCAEERTITRYSLIEESNHRPVQLPRDIVGPYLLYLRQGDEVLCLPIRGRGSAVLAAPRDPLARALIDSCDAGYQPLDDFLQAAEGTDVAAFEAVASLCRLTSSLRGVPPQCFDVLSRIAGRAKILTRMALMARAEERAAVLALADSLPFAWYLLPRTCWDEARAATFEWACRRLEQEGISSDATSHAMQMLKDAVDQLKALDPVLTGFLSGAGDKPDLKGCAQRFLHQAVDTVRGTRGSIFRQVHGNRLPPYLLQLPDHCLETLDAPCAAASAARGEWTPEIEHLVRIKEVRRQYPEYFDRAFAASI